MVLTSAIATLPCLLDIFLESGTQRHISRTNLRANFKVNARRGHLIAVTKSLVKYHFP